MPLKDHMNTWGKFLLTENPMVYLIASDVEGVVITQMETLIIEK